MKRNLQKRGAALLCALGMLMFTLAFTMVNARAEGATYPLYLSCVMDDEAVSGVRWNLYLIGTRTDDKTDRVYSFALNETFDDYNVNTDNLSASDVADLANTLAGYVVADGISPDRTGVTDENGRLAFEELAEGVYLLCGEEMTSGDKIYVPAASIVESGSNMYNDNYTVYPKFETRDVPKTPETEYSLLKSWEDDDNAEGMRPYGIDVEIYENGKLYAEVKLSAAENWSYSWKGSADSEWKVVEKTAAEGYTVVVKNNETKFVIVNTFGKDTPPAETTTTTTTTTSTSDESTSTTTTTTVVTTAPDTPETTPTTTTRKTSGNTHDIPQTGQLWWPVPVLVLGGVVCVAVGISLRRKNK